jgi:uncharacterized surface anchored protein
MRMKILILGILVLCMSQSNLCPLITSRIEGVVKDAETGEVIGNVKVFLFIYYKGSYDRKPHYETVTDKNGRFVFDQLKNNRYFLMCEHEDYLLSIPEKKLSMINLPSIIDMFDLQQGQIKHLEIQLQKGGKIKGRVLIKDENGVSGVKNVSINLENKQVRNQRYPLNPAADSNGNFLIGSLIPDDNYRIEISIHEGFPDFETDLSVKKGETTYIEHIFDATDNTGVFGTVILDGKPHDDCGVRLYSLSVEKTIAEIDTDDNGKYVMKNIPVGKYFIKFSYLDENKNFIQKEIEIEIKKGEMKQINMDF